MSHAEEEVVELLGALAQSDRRWILDRLSPAAKERLAERIASPSAVTRSGSPQVPAGRGAEHAEVLELEKCAGRVAAADASSMLRVLRDEPGWLVRSVLQLSNWPWRKAFLQALPATMRIDVTQILINEPAPGRTAEAWLLRELSARLVALPPESGSDSSFAALLARATRKVARR